MNKREVGKTYKTRNWGKVEVVDQKGSKCKVRFCNTGNFGWFLTSNVKKGKAKDHQEYERRKKEPVWLDYEESFVNNSGQSFKAFKKSGGKIKIRFCETGYTREVLLQNARKGKVRDLYAKNLYGVALYGEYDKSLEYTRQAKQLWKNMIKRCYSEKDSRGYFGRVFVSERWLTFANFLEDLPELEGFCDWLEYQNDKTKEPFELDKDSISKGNNIYSKDLCRFIPRSENRSLGKKGKVRNSDGEFLAPEHI